jgi:hypothetical protein
MGNFSRQPVVVICSKGNLFGGSIDPVNHEGSWVNISGVVNEYKRQWSAITGIRVNDNQRMQSGTTQFVAWTGNGHSRVRGGHIVCTAPRGAKWLGVDRAQPELSWSRPTVLYRRALEGKIQTPLCTGVTHLDQMTQQNAALVEQSAAAAESQKEQAIRLGEVVSTFRLDDVADPKESPSTKAPRTINMMNIGVSIAGGAREKLLKLFLRDS